MSKYTVQEGVSVHYRGSSEVSRAPSWSVWKGADRVSTPRGSEAEASIIAFALNAVAEGKVLLSASKELLADIEASYSHADPREHAVYDGPTEGVAP